MSSSGGSAGATGHGWSGHDRGVREQHLDRWPAFHRAPQLAGRAVHRGGALVGCQRLEQRLPRPARAAALSRSSAGRAARRRRAGRDGPGPSTRSIAAGSSRPSSCAATGRPRRSGTARLRRSSSGASSRKVNGRPFRISWASTDGSVVSRTTTADPAGLDRRRPVPSGRRCPSPRAGSPPASGARARDRGSPAGPGATFSWQAASVGNTAAIRSSASIRWIARRVLLAAAHPQHGQRPVQVPPPARRRTSGRSARPGGPPPRRSLEARNFGTRSSGKLCCGPSDSRIASSLAAACSSKSNVTQNRLRSASPSARFSRAPNGACPTSCIPPASSKNRSSTMVSMVGSTPSWASPAAR